MHTTQGNDDARRDREQRRLRREVRNRLRFQDAKPFTDLERRALPIVALWHANGGKLELERGEVSR